MDDLTLAATIKAALSGAASGAIFGAGGRFFTGAKKMSDILKAAGIGSIVGAGITGGSTAVGSELMGAPRAEEANPYTYRSALGGFLAGGAGGAGLAALLASGKMPSSALAKLGRVLPINNILTDKLSGYGKAPSMANMKKAVLMGGAAGALPSSYLEADEGMGVDIIMRELEEERKQKELERLIHGN